MKFKKLHPNAKLPVQHNPGDAGYDLCAVEDKVYTSTVALIPVGVAVEIPHGYVGLITDRSSVATKQFITKTAGTVDSGYRGMLHVALTHLAHDDIKVKAGDKIAQLVVVPCLTSPSEWVDELSETVRGDKGFGSSGR